MHSSSEPIRLGLTDNCHYVSANKLQDGSNTSTGDTVDPEYEVAEHPTEPTEEWQPSEVTHLIYIGILTLFFNRQHCKLM